MKIGKMSIALCCFITVFLSYSVDTKAAFDITGSTVTYDSNNGLLMMQDPMFSKIDYQNRFVSHAEKMTLGNITLSGTAEFSDGVMRMYVLNKNAVNQQTQFTTTQTVGNGMNLQIGAIDHVYKPPNSINVELVSASNARFLHVNVIGLRPVMKIHDFYSNVSTVDGEGNINLNVSGENLHISTFSVYAHHTDKTHTMNVTSTSATVSVHMPANTSNRSRTDTYTLYINGQNSMREITVNVSPKKIPPVEKPQDPTDGGSNDNDVTTDDDQNINQGDNQGNNQGDNKGEGIISNPTTPSKDETVESNNGTANNETKSVAQVFKDIIKQNDNKLSEIIEEDRNAVEPISEKKEVDTVIDMAASPLPEQKEQGNSWLLFFIAIPLLSCFGYFGWKVYKKH